MQLEEQVCSLELAKRLKELGVKQESVFSWRVPTGRDKIPKPLADEEIRLVYLWHEYQKELWDTYSAFTVAELGEMLRPHLKKSIWLADIRDAMEQATYMEDESDARAKMLIYLLENNPLIHPQLT